MKKRLTNERKVQKMENVQKAAKTLTMHTSVALIPVENCFCWIFESFFFFFSKDVHTHKEAVNQKRTATKCIHTIVCTLLLYTRCILIIHVPTNCIETMKLPEKIFCLAWPQQQGQQHQLTKKKKTLNFNMISVLLLAFGKLI